MRPGVPQPAEPVREGYRQLRRCRLCPRCCGVDRVAGERGFCDVGLRPRVASWGPHFGEEAPLVGRGGSGTVFLSGCNLGCGFCQNWDISCGGVGEDVGLPRLAAAMLELQGQGCVNINWVTPSHVVPQLLGAQRLARRRGLRLPTVYNTSAYDSVSTLRLLDGSVDIYLADLKWFAPGTGERLAAAPDYGAVARAALLEMYAQVGDLEIGTDGVAQKGLLVRHLVMPGGLSDSAEIFAWIARHLSPRTYVNVMGQYRPAGLVGSMPPLDRGVSRGEMRAAREAAARAGLVRLDGLAPAVRD